MITIITQYFSNLFSDAAWQVVQNFNETATKQMALFGAIQKFGILM
jgi:hypothetical protein